MYLLIAFRASAHSRDGHPVGVRPYTFMGFMVAIESALRPRAYFSPSGLHTAFGLYTIYEWSNYYLFI